MPRGVLYLLMLLGVALLAVFFIIIITSKPRKRKRIKRFVSLWKEQAAAAKQEFDSICTPSKLLPDGELVGFKSKYYSLYKAVKDFRFPKEKDEIQEDLSWIKPTLSLFENLRQSQLINNSKYFQSISLGLKEDYNSLTSVGRYVGYHEWEDFKNKWYKVLNTFNSQNSKSDYIDYLPDYQVFIDAYKFSNKQREKNNSTYVKNELSYQSDYFDKLFKYPLDTQQRTAIVTTEDNTLVVSSAGSGKTSTIVGKVRYLVERKGIKPEEILVVTYTRKAASELRERMDIPGITSSTFHKHAMDTLGLLTGSKPTIVAEDVLPNIIDKLIRTDKEFLKSFNKLESEYFNLAKDDHEYQSSEERMLDIQRFGLRSPYKDGDSNQKIMKSMQEIKISIILTHLGVDYRYEEPYEYDTSTQFRRKYKPDFVIHYKTKEYDNNGKENIVDKVLYLEHFGIDSNGKVPRWFGDGIEGGWEKAQQNYINGINWKRDVHKQHNTKLIETTSADFEKHSNMEEYIEELLNKNGVPTRHISEEEKRKKLREGNSRVDKSLFELISGFIVLMKSNKKDLDIIINQIIPIDNIDVRNRFLLRNIVKPIYEKYEQYLKENVEFDFTDILLKTADLCEQRNPYNYRYILVDEFQDISMDKYLYLKSLRKEIPFTTIFCVGDDWQSIYRFSGSDMTLFNQFSKFFGYTKECKIETTHRFGQPLLNASTVFILANPEQKEKQVRTTQIESTQIKFISYRNEEQKQIVKEIIDKIPANESVFILGRYSFNGDSIGVVTKKEGQRETHVFKTETKEVRYLTIHSSKGLEADNVIIIDCIGGFYGLPSQVQDDPIMEYVLSGSDSYENAEERRVFYVGVTRAKKCTYCLYDQENPSPFLKEFGEYNKFEDSTDAVCPRCHSGYVRVVKTGLTKYGDPYITVNCTNPSCDYFENIFGAAIHKYQSRQILETWSLSDVYHKIGMTCIQLDDRERICYVFNENKSVYLPLFIPQNIVVNGFLLEELRRNVLKYEVSSLLYSGVTIYVLKKCSLGVFVTDSDLNSYESNRNYFKAGYSLKDL